MIPAISAFMTGLEDLSFVENISKRYQITPKQIVQRACLLLCAAVVVLVILVFMQGGFSQSEGLEVEVSNSNEELSSTESQSTTVQSSTSFDAPAGEVSEAPSSALTMQQEIIVYVSGAVTSPGVYSMRSQNRISDAIRAAGGLVPEAAEAVVNLAQPLTDGMQIHVPLVSEVSSNAPLSGTTVQSAGSATIDSTASTALVNINTADITTLQTLDGVGPATAQKIIDYRTTHGGFSRIEDLLLVSGIGEKKFAALQNWITV